MPRVLFAAIALAVLSTTAHADDCKAGKPFDQAELETRLTAFASPDLHGRAPGTADDIAARKLITDRYACLGLTGGADDGSFTQPFEADGHKTANTVAILAGTTDEIVVVGAHHDHLGDKHLGANDNGSGVIGILAIAQSIAQLPDKPKRTIVFVTFGGEELGLLGSAHFVAHPPKSVALAKVVAFINLDMIGSYASTNAVYAFGSFPATAPGKIIDKLDDNYPKLRVGLGGHSVRGDQVDFCKAKIPYIFFWTPDKRCYHETCDTIDRIDFPHMSMIAQLGGDLVRRIADDKSDLVASRTKTGCGHK